MLFNLNLPVLNVLVMALHFIDWLCFMAATVTFSLVSLSVVWAFNY